MCRVAGSIGPSTVAVVIMSVMLLVLHGHVVVSTGLRYMVVIVVVVIVELLEE